MFTLFEELTRVADIDGGLFLIARDDPHLDARGHQIGNRLWYLFLERDIRGRTYRCLNLYVFIRLSMSLLPLFFAAPLFCSYLQTIFDSGTADEIELRLPLDSERLEVLILIGTQRDNQAAVLGIESLKRTSKIEGTVERRCSGTLNSSSVRSLKAMASVRRPFFEN